MFCIDMSICGGMFLFLSVVVVMGNKLVKIFDVILFELISYFISIFVYLGFFFFYCWCCGLMSGL